VRLVAAWANRTLLRILRFNHLTRLRTSEPQRRVGETTILDEPTNKSKRPRYNKRRRRCRLQRVLGSSLCLIHLSENQNGAYNEDHV